MNRIFAPCHNPLHSQTTNKAINGPVTFASHLQLCFFRTLKAASLFYLMRLDRTHNLLDSGLKSYANDAKNL